MKIFNVIILFAQKFEQLVSSNINLAILVKKLIPNKLILEKKIRKYQENINNPAAEKSLLNIVNFAITNVPFYREKYGNKPVYSKEEFEEKIGFLTKEDLRENRHKLLSSKFNEKDYELISTGGSTGEPSVFYLPKNRFFKEWAYVFHAWAYRGYKNHIRAVLRNHRLDPNEKMRLNIFRNELVFDAYRTEEKYFDFIYETMRKYNIKYFQSYPNLAFLFFKHLSEKGKDLSFINGVFLSSERFTDTQRQLLINRLKLPVTCIYGMSEQLVFAIDWDGSGAYEIMESYGYLELIDNKGNVINEPGREGEIVATGYDNYGMPLIRYRTGDVSEYKQVQPKRILKDIKGRKGQIIIQPDGTTVSVTSLNLHGDLFELVDGLQYYQDTTDAVEIRIIPRKAPMDEVIKNKFLDYFRDRFHPEMKVIIKEVKELERLSNGKLLTLISKL